MGEKTSPTSPLLQKMTKRSPSKEDRAAIVNIFEEDNSQLGGRSNSSSQMIK